MATTTDRKSLGNLERGATGAAVRKLQALMVAAGAVVPIDGVFGPLTERALASLQQRDGLKTTTGVCDADTWKRLIGETPELKEGAVSDDVRRLQALLVARGAGLVIDGFLGPVTARVAGKVDEARWRALLDADDDDTA